jgi:hypothetical protein
MIAQHARAGRGKQGSVTWANMHGESGASPIEITCGGYLWRDAFRNVPMMARDPVTEVLSMLNVLILCK